MIAMVVVAGAMLIIDATLFFVSRKRNKAWRLARMNNALKRHVNQENGR